LMAPTLTGLCAMCGRSRRRPRRTRACVRACAAALPEAIRAIPLPIAGAGDRARLSNR
jgi:hypothetical protein